MRSKFNEKGFIIVMFFGSLFVRVLYLVLNVQHIYNDILVNPDSNNYNTIARNIVQGHGFSLVPPYLTSFVEPGYPIFLSFIYFIFGESFINVIIFQILLDSISCVLVYFFAKKLINLDVAILSSIIYMCYPDFIFSSCQIMTETLSLFVFIATTLIIIHAEDKKKNILFIFGGLMCGVTILVKGMILPFPFLLFFYFLLKRNFRKYLLFIISVFISFSPWIIRNYIVHKSFIVVGTRSGLSFWMANNEKSKGSWIKDEKMIQNMLKKWTGEDMIKEGEMSKIGFELGFKYLKGLDFKELVVLKLKKFLYLWDFRNYGIMYWYIILLPFAIIGIFINFYKFDRNSILYYLILTPVITSLIFCGDVRFRIIAMPYINILQAIGILYFLPKYHFNLSQNKL